ncbi:beta-glucosidase btgE [Phytophthora nicotianae]|uniref:Beta-glucosidase btgE n=1 Tax=Phytophthora nicotianae TaxID=4792 RepID=A0A0W8CVD1_PHYNI|nr:beta-glucosidase btgE [Phytophthora nicotianae]
MEDEDFVADSDEDEQEMLEALAMAEERLARQRLEAGNHQQEESQVEPKDQNMEQSTAILVTPEQSQAVREHDTAQVEVAEDREPDGELEVDEEQGSKGKRRQIKNKTTRKKRKACWRWERWWRWNLARGPESINREAQGELLASTGRSQKMEKQKTSSTTYAMLWWAALNGTLSGTGREPDDLPEDVARETGIRLASTRHGLMKQLQEVFAQQQENIANFHEEQKMVDQKMEDLSGMPMSDLQDLYRKVFDLDKVFLTKTLVNAGEDVMDSISKKLDRHGKPPDGFEQLDTKIGEWKDELKDCSRWVHAVKEAVGDAFARRNAQIPVVQVAQAEYSSDSSYSADDFDAGDIEIETAAVAAASDNIDFSFDYEVESASNSRNQNRQLDYVSIARERRPNVSKAGKPNNRKKTIRSTTMEDYFSQRGPSNRFRSNFRLTGRQKKILPSDPRFDWVRIARKKQQRVGSAIRDRSTGPSSLDFSNRHGSVHAVHEVRSANVSSREDRNSVQAQRMHLRNERFRGPPKKQRPRGSLLAQSAPQTVRSSSQPVYPAGISFDDVTPERRQRPVEVVNTTIRPSNSNQHAVNWRPFLRLWSMDLAQLVMRMPSPLFHDRKKKDFWHLATQFAAH